jgi:hypothetical protein
MDLPEGNVVTVGGVSVSLSVGSMEAMEFNFS